MHCSMLPHLSDRRSSVYKAKLQSALCAGSCGGKKDGDVVIECCVVDRTNSDDLS